MSSLGPNFNPEAFRKNFPIIIASSRATALLQPMRVRWVSGGYEAGQTMARNTTDGWYQKYNGSGSSGIDTATSILFEPHGEEDFDLATTAGSCMAVGIFGQCLLFKDKLTGLDAGAYVDLGARDIIDATGVTLFKF